MQSLLPSSHTYVILGHEKVEDQPIINKIFPLFSEKLIKDETSQPLLSPTTNSA